MPFPISFGCRRIERAQARASKSGKQGKSDGSTPQQRRGRDAKALQEKDRVQEDEDLERDDGVSPDDVLDDV